MFILLENYLSSFLTIRMFFMSILFYFFLADSIVLADDPPKKQNILTQIEEMTLEQIEDYAINNNPLYIAEKKNIGMARGDVITASLYKNPSLEFEQQFINGRSGYDAPLIGSTGGSSSGGVETAPKIFYDFDIGGIRQAKTRLARQAFRSSIANFSDFDRVYRFRLRQNYWYYLYLCNQVDFQKDFYDNYIGLLKLNFFRVEKGDISQLEYDRLELEKVRIEKEYRDVLILRTQAVKDLKVLIGVDPSDYVLEFKQKLDFKTLEELKINLEDFNIENRPDYMFAKSRVAESKLNLDLKKKEGEALPFLSLGTELRHKQGQNYWGVFAKAPLKINDRGQGEVYKAEEGHKKSMLELKARYNQIYGEVFAAKKELLSREELLKEYRKINLLEKNKSVQEKFRTAYLRGASSLVSFLEAEKNYLSVLKGYNEQMYLYYNALEYYKAAVGRMNNKREY